MRIDGVSDLLNYFQVDPKTNSKNASSAAKQFSEIIEIDTSRDNLMADNTSDPNQDKATYATVMQQFFQSRDIAGASRAAIVSQIAAAITAVHFLSKNASENNMALASEGYYSQVNQAEITESSEDHLKSEREKLEEAAPAPPASGDAQSASAQAAATSDSGSASTSEAAAASVDVTV